MFRTAILLAFLVFPLLGPAAASATVIAGTDACVWDSSVPNGDPLRPIGGSGQINGEFILETVDVGPSAIQIGLRGQERGVGPTLPRVGNVFFAETGFSTGTRAKWNYDFHVDFGTDDAETTVDGGSLESQTLRSLTPLNIRDYTVEMLIDLDPSTDTSFITFDINEFLTIVRGAGSDVHLLQDSHNLDFLNPDAGFDPTLEGRYDFVLRVKDGGTVLAQVFMQVVVMDMPDPSGVVDVGLAVGESVDPVVLNGAPGALTYVVTASNPSANDAHNVEVTETLNLPAGVTVASGPTPSAGSVSGTAPTFTWTVGTLAAGTGATLTLGLDVAAGATLGNGVIGASATVTALDEPDSNLFNQSAAATTSIVCLDTDGDGVCDLIDNCPVDANPGQSDLDDDGVGNACDLCFGEDTSGDSDSDGACDANDFCIGDDLTGDADMDGICFNRDCDDNDPSNACFIFADGFESGDVLSWTTSF